MQDYLRQNNTGKLLWQVFGVPSATLCLFGIAEDEDVMWDAFKQSGSIKISLYSKVMNTIISNAFINKSYKIGIDIIR